MSNISTSALSDSELVDLIGKRFSEVPASVTLVIAPFDGDLSIKDEIINRVHPEAVKYFGESPVSKVRNEIHFPTGDPEHFAGFLSKDMLIVVFDSVNTPEEVLEVLKATLTDKGNQDMILQAVDNGF